MRTGIPGRKPTKILVIGLGNPILGDDGLGWRIAREVERLCSDGSHALLVEVDTLAAGGLALMERLLGYQSVILIDALTTDDGTIGALVCLPFAEVPIPGGLHLGSTHDASLQTALSVGQELGASLPKQIWVVGIKAEHVYEFSEQLSPAVEAKIPLAVDTVMDLIECLSSFTPEADADFDSLSESSLLMANDAPEYSRRHHNIHSKIDPRRRKVDDFP